MKSVFFGTSDFAVPILHGVATATDVVAVVTQPARPAGRGHKMLPTPVAIAAAGLGLTVHVPSRLRAFAAELRALEPDILVVASYGRILPQPVLDAPLSGIAFNVHPSLLPLYRGATPLQSAIRDGRSTTGVTIIAMDAGMDTGDIVLQESTPLGPSETYGELHDRLAERGAALLIVAIDRLRTRTLERTPQAMLGVAPNDIASTLTRPLGKEDMVVDWSWPAVRIVDTIRSLAPLPTARGALRGEMAKLNGARLAHNGESGFTADGGYVEVAGDGAGVVLLQVTPPNRGTVSGAVYARTRTAV